jgi:exosortase A
MSAVLPVPAQRSAWPVALIVQALALAAVFSLYGPTFASMVAVWARSETFAHAYLVAPIALWLMWRKRAELVAAAPRPAPVWLLAIALAALAWLAGDLAGVNAVVHFAATAILVFAVPAVLGNAVAGVMLFPLAFLFFMVPVGDFLLPVLMEWTADFTVAALRFVGVPVYREGLQFIIPTGAWSVVEACSGVRYLIASFMVGSLFAYLNYRTARRRMLFGIVSLVVPIVANWLRAFGIVMLGHLSGNKIAVGVDHLIYGWVFFGVVIMLMFMIGARWSEAPADPAPAVAAPAPAAAAAPVQPARLAATVVLLVLVIGLPRWVTARAHAPMAPMAALALPELPGTASAEAATSYRPIFEAPAARAERSYAFGGDVVTVDLAYYRQQGYQSKLGSSRNALVLTEDSPWHVVTSGMRTVAVDGAPTPLRAAEIRSGSGAGTDHGRPRVHLLQVYWVDGRLTTSANEATARAVAAQLLGRGDDAAALTLLVSGTEAAEARRALDAFAARHLNELTRFVAGVRARPTAFPLIAPGT